MDGLADFPAPAAPPPATPEHLRDLGLALRAATSADLPALARLYADTRAEELAAVPWPDVLRHAFLDQQFRLQHKHYVGHFAGADFLVIERGAALVGRYYLLREAPEHLLVDISLFAAWRGQGIGRALIEASRQEAADLGRGMGLHVHHGNPRARALYLRLGFVPDGRTDTHEHMAWRPAGAAAPGG